MYQMGDNHATLYKFCENRIKTNEYFLTFRQQLRKIAVLK